VTEVPVEPNRLVKKGELLFRIDPTQYQNELSALQAKLAADEAKLASASANLADASAGARELREQLKSASAQVAVLQPRLDLARLRRNRLAVVVKPSGVPSISELWIEQARTLSAGTGVELELIEVDNACYQVVAAAPRFDVVVAPNLFGDIVADTAALAGSRGLVLANRSTPGERLRDNGAPGRSSCRFRFHR
jgi:multidrug resistance efflux pump